MGGPKLGGVLGRTLGGGTLLSLARTGAGGGGLLRNIVESMVGRAGVTVTWPWQITTICVRAGSRPRLVIRHSGLMQSSDCLTGTINKPFRRVRDFRAL